MGKKNEEELGSWNLQVGSFGYLVVYVKREEATGVWGKSFVPSEFEALFYENVV